MYICTDENIYRGGNSNQQQGFGSGIVCLCRVDEWFPSHLANVMDFLSYSDTGQKLAFVSSNSVGGRIPSFRNGKSFFSEK
jgi:hypothetical protein